MGADLKDSTANRVMDRLRPFLKEREGLIPGLICAKPSEIFDILQQELTDESRLVGTEKVLEERGRMYGDSRRCHESVGRIWAAILEHHYGNSYGDIPPHVVAMMFAAFKCLRAAGPNGPQEDSYLDIQGYTELARKMPP